MFAGVLGTNTEQWGPPAPAGNQRSLSKAFRPRISGPQRRPNANRASQLAGRSNMRKLCV
eukprot:1220612-Alexandrium_andersonii.AAC.1